MAEGSHNLMNKLKSFFDKSNGFDKDVMIPAEEKIEIKKQEIENSDKNLISGVKEFLDRNVKSKTEGLKEQRLSELEELKDKVFENQDIGELSQNFLESLENSDTDQMKRISNETQGQQENGELDQKVPWEGHDIH